MKTKFQTSESEYLNIVYIFLVAVFAISRNWILIKLWEDEGIKSFLIFSQQSYSKSINSSSSPSGSKSASCAMCVSCYYDTLGDCRDIARGAGEGERNVWSHGHKCK